jgi:protein phosphatase 4 regulatory subunit 3
VYAPDSIQTDLNESCKFLARVCRYITKNELFREPLDAFLENGDKPNLLNSTFLEMMEFMRSSDQSSLLLHFVDRYWSEVEGLNYVTTFQNMRDSVDKMQV